MWRYLAGAGAAALLMVGALFAWQGSATRDQPVPAVPAAPAGAAGGGDEDIPGTAPAASAKTREQRRFSRYDHDKDGAVSRDEYLASRRKAFAKLDKDGDGRLSFDEYAVKTEDKFAKADGDRSGVLTPAEFATTKVQRKARTAAARPCPPAAAAKDDDEG